MKYDKETIREIFRLGSHEEFAFDAKSPLKARRLRNIMYYYRHKMKLENDEFFKIANSVVLELDDNFLIASPFGLQGALQEAIQEHRMRKRLRTIREKK